jgi:hypothetical protein
MPNMTTRTRWLLIGIGVLVVLGLLYWFNSDLQMESVKNWVVQPGETLTLQPDEVGPDDEYRCPGKGGVNGTPEPGTGVGNSGGLSVTTANDGTVTVECEPGPAGNV